MTRLIRKQQWQQVLMVTMIMTTIATAAAGKRIARSCTCSKLPSAFLPMANTASYYSSFANQNAVCAKTAGFDSFSTATRLSLSNSSFRGEDDEVESRYDALRDELRRNNNQGREEQSKETQSQSQSQSQSSPNENASVSVSINKRSSQVQELLDLTMTRAGRTLSTTAETQSVDQVADQQKEETHSQPTQQKKQHVDKRRYLSNPCVTPTALAHSLWKETVIPGVDTIIDATCGNGKDTVILAEMLFGDRSTGTDESTEKNGNADEDIEPELLAIDIQTRAAANTTEALSQVLDEPTWDKVRVLATSHAPLMKPRSDQSVGLICYNLGWLPGSSTQDKNAFSTKMITTLVSITDAALMLRVGGLLSVMTYPGTCQIEADAVKYFCEGLAMLTTRDKAGWQGFVENIPNDADGSGKSTVRDVVRSSLERVVREGKTSKQTWRVFEHRPLGRPLSPILVAAMRIK